MTANFHSATSTGAFDSWLAWLCGAILIAIGSTTVGAEESPADVTTYHYDAWRTGWNARETTLSPVAIRNSSFGELHSVLLDEQVDAQPLVVSNLEVDGRVATIVYVATENNTIYAI